TDREQVDHIALPARDVSVRAQVICERLRLLEMPREPVLGTGFGHRLKVRVIERAPQFRRERRSVADRRHPRGDPRLLSDPRWMRGPRTHFLQRLARAVAGVARRADRDRPEPARHERRQPVAGHGSIINDESKPSRRPSNAYVAPAWI